MEVRWSTRSFPAVTHLIHADFCSGLIDFIVMCVTYIFFYRACKTQGLDRKTLPYTGWGQPYCAIFGCFWMVLVAFFEGYISFQPWSTTSFFQSYTLQLLAPILFVFWKVVKRTKMVRSHEADLVWDRPIIEAYEATFLDLPVGFWREIGELLGIRGMKGVTDKGTHSIFQ